MAFNAPLVIKFNSISVPEFKEVRNEDIVYYGEQNDYPDYILKLFNRSAKNNAIINSKANYIYGNGWEIDTRGMTVGNKSFLNEFIKGFSNEVDKITKKVILDFEIFNGFYLSITWNKAGTKIAEISHVDFSNIRSNKDNSEFYYTKKWFKVVSGKNWVNKKYADEEDYKVYPAFDSEKRKGTQILFYKGYRPNLDVYPLPEYLGANVAIETDIEINSYHYNNLKNGFTATVLINFNNGIPTEEEKKKIETQIKDKLAGSENAGKFVLSFADGKDKSAEVVVLSMSDAHNQFENLRKDVTQEIFIGHRIISPMLFGVRVEGQLGGRSEMIEANELFQNLYVSPKQKIFEEVFNGLLAINGAKGTIKLTKTSPIGLDWFGVQNLYNLLTPDQKKEKAGLPVKTTFKSEVEFDDLKDIEVFKKYGSENKGIVLSSRPVKYENEEKLIESELDFMSQSFALEIDLKTLDRSIIDLLTKEPLTTPEALAKTIGVDIGKINKAIVRLVDSGAIKIQKGASSEGTKLIPTKEAAKVADEKPTKTVNIFIKYSYEVTPGLGAPIIKNTRDFCRELVQLNKMYTRKEIESITNEVGYSVWLYRGGFYHNPKDDTTTPYCRHRWVQNIVREES